MDNETYTVEQIRELIQSVLGEPVELEDEIDEEEVKSVAEKAAKHLKKKSAIGQ